MSDMFIDLTAPNGLLYTQPTGLFINNAFVRSKFGEMISSINPVNQEEIVSVSAASADDVDMAVQAARTALRIDKNKKILAVIESWDNGTIA